MTNDAANIPFAGGGGVHISPNMSIYVGSRRHINMAGTCMCVRVNIVVISVTVLQLYIPLIPGGG